MSNMFKTAILLAVLTAMLILIGGAIGGRQGMMVAFVLAMAMNFFSYWFSDKIVLSMYGAQPIDEAQAPRLYAILRRLTTRAQIPMPRVYHPDRHPQRLRHRPKPRARGRRGDGRHHADPRRGRAGGCARPRALPREEPRRADFDDRGHAGRRHHVSGPHGAVGGDVRRPA